MPAELFDHFKAELDALRVILAGIEKKTLRDDDVRERFRTLFRTWVSAVHPSIEPHLETKKDFHKLSAELESLAKLTAKIKSVQEYRKRVNRAIGLANGLVLYLPPTAASLPPSRPTSRENLFVPGIPDLPTRFVPNPLIGWKQEIQAFVRGHPFDKSVFIMIRYHRSNEPLIKRMKAALAGNHLYGILASEHNLTGDLYNPIACLLCCSRGIAVFDEPRAGDVFNPNVAYELGMMHLLGRNCLILKHLNLKSLHTDILMKLYVEYDTPEGAASSIKEWVSAP